MMDPNEIEHSDGCDRDPWMPGKASSESIVGKFIPNVVVVGSRGCSLFKLFMSGLFCLILGLIILAGESGTFIYLLAAVTFFGFLAQLRFFVWPPRFVIQQGDFSIHLSRKLTTPAYNVLDLSLEKSKLRITFNDLQQIHPSSLQSDLANEFKQKGFHYEGFPGAFTLEQINEIRHILNIDSQVQDLGADRLASFETKLSRNTPKALVTPAIVFLNVAILVLMGLEGANVLMPHSATMIEWGANVGPLTTSGEAWRLVTSMFLHFGVIHLLFNMWILWDVGRLVERLVGSAGFAIGYLISGFFGSVASLAWHSHHVVVGAGASGAVFGVFGMLLGFSCLQRGSTFSNIFREHRNSTLFFIGFNVFIGLSVEWIDMAAHLGGLLAGFFCGLILSQNLDTTKTLRRTIRLASLIAVATIASGSALLLMPVIPGMDQVTTILSSRDDPFADYNEAIRLDPKNAEAYYNRGNSYLKKGDWNKAIADFTEAIRLNPKFAGAYVNRGLVYKDNGEPDKAIVDYTEAIRLNPKDAGAYVNRGLVYKDNGEPDKAIAEYAKAKELGYEPQ
jgi:rhomboid protease GluP